MGEVILCKVFLTYGSLSECMTILTISSRLKLHRCATINFGWESFKVISVALHRNFKNSTVHFWRYIYFRIKLLYVGYALCVLLTAGCFSISYSFDFFLRFVSLFRCFNCWSSMPFTQEKLLWSFRLHEKILPYPKNIYLFCVWR